MTRAARMWLRIGLGLLIAVVLAGTAGYLTFRNFTAFPGEADYFSVLLIGEDKSYLRNGEAVEATGRMDAILVLAVPRKPGPSLLMSVPRDTLVRYPGGDTRRVNASMALGGIELATQVVSSLVGLDIHRYMRVDFAGFVGLVDAVGGVDIEVDKVMKYTDKAGGYSIDLQPGMHHMDGETALSYVRYRNDALGDISRTSRQQRFLRALMSELVSVKAIKAARSVLDLLTEYTDTDMSTKEMLAVGWRLRSMSEATLRTATLPGRFQGAYWEVDPTATAELIRSLGLPFGQ
ncbi:MAG: putative transcriptional regulator YwtF [Firmicutes bacterium ADurb.Bin506]|jgi:LCP family protein required for cell wall assembly|nr:MAG: putative transcriptional regulator YwtF [Firmicutes bacterium ADurb.Bin506]